MSAFPKKIIALPNADKSGWHEKWDAKRDPLNLPHPARVCLMGPPNSGKSTVIKNMIIRADPPFQKISVIHCDWEWTKEYADLDVTMMGEIPAPEEFEGKEKELVVIDDLELKNLDKTQRAYLDRLFGYVSTHKNVSVYLTSQDPFNVPAICRRCSNCWILWKSQDLDSLSSAARKTGMTASSFNSIFKHLLTGSKDSLWVDLTTDSPYPLRKNGYEMITKIEDGADTVKKLKDEDKFAV